MSEHDRVEMEGIAMPDVLILEFTGAGADQYWQVNDLLGINMKTGEGDWPAGLISHVGATRSTGDLTVVEVWESQAAQSDFMASRLGPALGKAGVPEPTRAEWLSGEGVQHRG
jgi:hypothetical protein